ncbi:outer membrane transport family protein, partial [Helicobacter pylori]|nr:outer membrane transport family protein [Helicobacter pylori]
MKNFSPLYFLKKFKKRHLIALSLPLFSYANGFKIQEQSLNGTALGSAYVAGARGADASFYNPA